MSEKVTYIDVWNKISIIRSITVDNLHSILTKEQAIALNNALCEYTEKYAKQLTLAFDKILSGWEDLSFGKDPLAEWLSFAMEVCTLKLAVALTEMNNKTIPEAVEILEFFLDSNTHISIKALGLYNIAATFCSQDAQLCYDIQSGAFEIYPELGKLLGKDYVYDKNLIKDTYFESCPICGNESATAFYCVPQFWTLNTGDRLAPVKLWKKCDRCANLYAYNFPVSEMGAMNGHYTRSSSDLVIEPRFSLRIYSDIFNKCLQYTNGNKYLEVGIGQGEMLAAAMEMGFEVDAVEICREDCEKVSAALDIPVNWCDFVNFETDKTYDIIVMGDVLEHVSDPMKVLGKAASLLNPKGVLWLSTPNYNSAFSRLKKFTDPMWNQRNHFTYFSYETILPFLEELNFEVKRYDISNRYNGSMELYCVKK